VGIELYSMGREGFSSELLQTHRPYFLEEKLHTLPARGPAVLPKSLDENREQRSNSLWL
jgi:hypothetical protein